MSSIGLSVPPGLTITTETCREYNENGNQLPAGLWDDVLDALKTTEEILESKLGDPSKPLLLSVRSGAAVSTIRALVIQKSAVATGLYLTI